MNSFLMSLWSMGATASWTALAVLVLRALLGKAPKAYTLALWLPVALRLVCPVSLPAPWIVLPSQSQSAPAAQPSAPISQPEALSQAAVHLYFTGLLLLGLYCLVSYLRLRLRLGESVRQDRQVWHCDRLSGSFVLGLLRPRIYLPATLSGQDRDMVLAHERAHLSHGDHLWKALAFFLTCLHWYNPLLWLCYVLFGRDLELACDERVLEKLPPASRRAYAHTLLRCSLPRSAVGSLAFGKQAVRARLRRSLSYRPASWLAKLVLTVLCLGAVVSLATDPVRAAAPESPVWELEQPQEAVGEEPEGGNSHHPYHYQDRFGHMLHGDIDRNGKLTYEFNPFLKIVVHKLPEPAVD